MGFQIIAKISRNSTRFPERFKEWLTPRLLNVRDMKYWITKKKVKKLMIRCIFQQPKKVAVSILKKNYKEATYVKNL